MKSERDAGVLPFIPRHHVSFSLLLSPTLTEYSVTVAPLKRDDRISFFFFPLENEQVGEAMGARERRRGSHGGRGDVSFSA